MKIKVLAASLAVVSCGLAITIVSCNNDNGVATAPSQPTHGGKNPQALDVNCNSTLAVDRCALGAATTTYDQESGVLSVTNSNDPLSGLKSTFGAAHDGHFVIKTNTPQGPGQQLSAVAYDGLTREGKVDITNDVATHRSAFTPTFDAGDGIYKAVVYNDGQQVASQLHIPGGSTTYASLSVTITIRIWWVVITITINQQHDKGAHVNAVDATAGACEWGFATNDGNPVNFTLPNGLVVPGDEIRFTEEVDGSGRYPYHSVDRLDVLSNLGSFDVLSEHAGN